MHCRQEVEAERALLRAERYYKIAPKANSSSAAAHLINYGLHCVTDRLKDSKDLRMSSLKSVNNLVSLQSGDKSQYKWGSRQPVRRRRGDVHRDMTVVTARLHWAGNPLLPDPLTGQDLRRICNLDALPEGFQDYNNSHSSIKERPQHTL